MADTTQLLQSIAGGLDSILNGEQRSKKNGFVLLVFPFDGPDNARTNYVSNAKREDIVIALKEIVSRFEGQPETRGYA